MRDQNLTELLKNKNFVKLWGAQMLSQFSIQIITFFILTKIFAVTQSTIAVSFMWIAGALPALMFGPFTGAVVDNVSRRKLLLGSAFLQALVVTSLIFFTRRIFFLYVIVFIYWFLDQVYYPAQQATAPTLVKKSQLPVINGLFLLTQQVSIVVGFGLGGILLSVFGQVPTILFAVVNLFAASFLVSLLPDDSPKITVEKSIASFFQDFVDGYQFVRSHPGILSTVGTVIGTQVIITIISTSIPGYSQQILGINLNDASLGLITPAAIGALAATFVLPKILHKYNKTSVIQFGWILGAGALVILGLLGFLPSYSRIPIALLAAILLGTSATSVIVPAQSLLQEKTPDHLRGRVYGQLGFLLILSTTLPLIASAAVADALGVSTLMGLLGMVLLVGFLLARVKHIFTAKY